MAGNILKLMRIKNHSTDTLCRQIYEAGRTKGWPGLDKKVRVICKTLNIPDVKGTFVDKSDVKKAIFNHHYDAMKEEMFSMSKLEPVKN